MTERSRAHQTLADSIGCGVGNNCTRGGNLCKWCQTKQDVSDELDRERALFDTLERCTVVDSAGDQVSLPGVPLRMAIAEYCKLWSLPI